MKTHMQKKKQKRKRHISDANEILNPIAAPQMQRLIAEEQAAMEHETHEYHEKFQQFLAGRLSARLLCHRCDLADLANVIVPVLFDMQAAHERIVHREALKLIVGIIRAFRTGMIQAQKPAKVQLAGLLGLSTAEFDELEKLLEPLRDKVPAHQYAAPPQSRKGLLASTDIDLPEVKGTYVLIASVPQLKRIEIDQLGEFDIVPGYYAYVGSASGAGGLRARIGHYLESTAAPHWHMDYLLQVAQPIEVWYSTADHKLERRWADLLEQAPSFRVPIPRFGASDYHRSRSSHLFYSKRRPKFGWFRQQLLEVEDVQAEGYLIFEAKREVPK